MIAFREGHDPNDPYNIPAENLEKLIKALLSNDSFYEGSFHEGLSPTQIEQIISYLMYTKEHECVHLIINKEADGYHLNLTIDKTQK